MKSFAILFLVLGFSCVNAGAQSKQVRTTMPRPTVLVTASTETDSTTTATGAATNVGSVIVGTGGANTSTYEHSEVWEVVRRFEKECPSASFVTNRQTPHTLTVQVDYQKLNGGFLMGTVTLYQLVLLDSVKNPLYVSKKNWLRREIKPICKIIQKRR
ncbi:MAG: hypothetical protein ACRD2D_10955 [Terriglobales bacterium]